MPRYHGAVLKGMRKYVRKHQLLRPGERVGVAVSGGPDSVALLRALVEAKAELGIVLSVLHFNHQLRGEESDADERFVRELAHAHGLEMHAPAADTRQFAREKELSLEAAARELRYSCFGRLIKEQSLDKVATAHTLDDQAETVLLRVIRGTGTSGLSGIHPRLVVGPRGDGWKGIIRPLLSTRRAEIECYLREKRQAWRTDSTNSETVFTRNRLRHELLPRIAQDFNPEVNEALSNLAEIARAEDDFWSAETAEAFVRVHRNQQLNVPELLKLPLALQRRVLRLGAIQSGATLDFHHSERILEQLGNQAKVELPNGFRAVIAPRSIRFESTQLQAKPCSYSYRLDIPGHVDVAELGIRVSTLVITDSEEPSRYNDEPRLALDRLPKELVVRNWRPGDRFWPAHTRSPKKVKELLQERHLPSREKALWPVALAGDDIVWMRGFPVAGPYVARQGKAVVVEAVPLTPKQ
ncbi:MAG: tRNA lysidine(34) synthetase TilS [Terriglobales bacterium]